VNIVNRWHQLAVNKIEFYCTLHGYPIHFVFGIIQQQIQQGIIGLQIAALKLKQHNPG